MHVTAMSAFAATPSKPHALVVDWARTAPGRFALKPQAVGIAWYSGEDYPEILKMMVDADHMPVSFHEWRERAIEVEAQLKARGFVVVRAPVHATAFQAWCDEAGRMADADARCQYAADFAECREIDSRPIRIKVDQADRDQADVRRA